MPALFPNSVRIYAAKTDLVDTVLAEHVNLLQDEVTAVQSTLGTGLLASSWSGTYTNPLTHATVSARLANIEAGILYAISGSGARSKTYVQNTQPTAWVTGDSWLDTTVSI